MYESYWNMSERPFSPRLDATQFYRGKSHHAALLRLRYGLDNFTGPGVVMGLSGTGKSSLVRVFADENRDLCPLIHLVFPSLTADELLRVIAKELSGSTAVGSATDDVLRSIQQSLREISARGQRPLICFDDAHLLADDTLQRVVQPLLNLAESDSEQGMSILLTGLPVMSARLQRIGELAERIAVATPLSGFTENETCDYVSGRIKRVTTRDEIFTGGALHRLHQVSGGNPRRINRLADMALLVGFAEQLDQITEAEIEAVSAELIPSAA